MPLTEEFIADVENVIAGYTLSKRAEALALIKELERTASEPATARMSDQCYKLQAKLYIKMEDYELAMAAANRALLLMPLDDGLISLRADIHRLKHENTLARRDYAKVVETTPDAVTAWVNLAELHMAKKEPEAALLDITEALKHEPRSFRLIYRRGLIYIELNRGNDAIADFQTVATMVVDDNLRRDAKARLRELGVR